MLVADCAHGDGVDFCATARLSEVSERVAEWVSERLARAHACAGTPRCGWTVSARALETSPAPKPAGLPPAHLPPSMLHEPARLRVYMNAYLELRAMTCLMN